MKIELKPKHYIGIGFAIVIIILDFIFFFSFDTNKLGPKIWYFNPILVIAVFIGGIFFVLDILNEGKRQKELEVKFLEFVRNLVEIVRSGVSIPQAILHVSNTNSGALTPYIQKLANQIEWGYPLHSALTIFANETKNEVIKRSIAIVIEAEKSGGDMGSVLEAVTRSVLEIKQVKEERKSSSYSQTIQGYIIYFVFVAIMVVLQIFLIPKISAISGDIGSGLGSIGLGSLSAGSAAQIDFGNILIATIIVQGIFAGLMIGKFAEGDFRSGVRHSLIMVLGGYLITSTVTGLVKPSTSIILLIPYDMLIDKIKCKIKEE